MQEHKPNQTPKEKKPLELLQEQPRNPALEADVHDDLAKAFCEAVEHERKARRATEAAKVELLKALGQAERGRCSFARVEFFEQQRKQYIVPATSFRVLRISPLK